MIEQFSIVRVVTKNIVTDSFQSIRNIFGLRLRGYEGMIQQATDEITKEASLKYNIKWFRYIINPLTEKSAIVMIYGEGEKNEQ